MDFGNFYKAISLQSNQNTEIVHQPKMSLPLYRWTLPQTWNFASTFYNYSFYFCTILYKWNHMVCNISCLISFTSHNVFKICPYWRLYKYFILIVDLYCIVRIYHNLFIHSPVNILMGCFQFGMLWVWCYKYLWLRFFVWSVFISLV